MMRARIQSPDDRSEVIRGEERIGLTTDGGRNNFKAATDRQKRHGARLGSVRDSSKYIRRSNETFPFQKYVNGGE